MIRGIATSFTLQLPFKKSEVESVKIKFWQPGNYGTIEEPLPLYKYLANCTGDSNSNTITVSLSPSETRRFSDRLKAYTQWSVKPFNGSAIATHQHLITVYPLDDEMIPDDGENPTVPPGTEQWIILDGGAIYE